MKGIMQLLTISFLRNEKKGNRERYSAVKPRIALAKVLALILFALTLLALKIPQATAQTCRWDGTAPFCDGECGANETEVLRLDSVPDFWTPPYVNQDPPFGATCLTGTKALCCSTPGRTCRWDGTAPFCEGECQPGEVQAEPPPGSSGGSACWTGSKVYCCRSTVNTLPTRARLEASAEFTRYAALWEQSQGYAWQARHGLSAAQYQQEFNTLVGQGYRLVDISGYSVGDNDTYAAIWEQSPGPAWQARHGLTAEQYQREFNTLVGQGYRLVNVTGYSVAGQDRYAAIWEQSPRPAWQARHGLTAEQYQQEFNTLVGQGYRLIDVSGYNTGGQDRYAAIWEQSPGPAWQARHGLTSAQYQREFNTLVGQGYRLVNISGWRSGDTAHYAAIWEKIEGPPWVSRHGMLSDVYQEEFDKLAREGYQLRRISGYHTYD